MRYLVNNETNPYFNLALEDYVLNELDVDDDFFILWSNESSIIVGKNQNTFAEINEAKVKEKNVLVARRITGGGAVYHDLGNLNFSFIINTKDEKSIDFKKYSIPIVNALKKLGISVSLSGRNDLEIDGYKISGNAQRHVKGKVLHHGTLLFDVDIDMMASVLNVGDEKFISKAAKSIRSRVSNIKSYLPDGISIIDFKESLHQELAKDDTEIILSSKDLDAIRKKVEDQFGSWEFIYGSSPAFNFEMKQHYPWGNIQSRLQVEEGRIKAASITGDYFSVENTKDIEEALIDAQYSYDSIKEVLSRFNLNDYFHGIENDQLLICLYV